MMLSKVQPISHLAVSTDLTMPVTYGITVVLIDTSVAAVDLTLRKGSESGVLLIMPVSVANDWTVTLPSGTTANGEAGPFVFSIRAALWLVPVSDNYVVLNPSVSVP